MADNLSRRETHAQLLEQQPEKEEKKIGVAGLGEKKFWWILFFLLALVPRLIFIFYVSTPDNPGAGWFGDAYHHWQIAYLSREIGFGHGFLRLWDLKGMEFFWGLLHPLMTMLAFWVSGGVTIGAERAMTAVFGSVSVVLIYLIVKRHWNTAAGAGAAIFAALNPVGVFNDGSGMVEPLAIPFLLLAVYLWPKKPFWVGVALVVALTGRAEYWVFAIGLVVAMMVFSKKVKLDNKVVLFGGFILPFIFYLKYLLNYTNNAIYPFYWNYVTNIFGTWQLKAVLEPQDIQAKYIFLSIFLVSLALSVLVMVKKPRGMFFYLLGLGNWLFLGATFGIGQYIKSYMTYVWYVRFMILPYAFLGAVLAIGLFYFLPKIPYLRILAKVKINWLIFFLILGVFELVWTPIMNRYERTEPNWSATVTLAKNIAAYYHGGGLLLMEGNPEITYALVRLNNVKGKNIIGEMFDPYYYMKDEDPYKNWGDNRKVVLSWIKENNIRTIVTYQQYTRYAKLAEKEPEMFSKPTFIPNSNLVIYEVDPGRYKD